MKKWPKTLLCQIFLILLFLAPAAYLPAQSSPAQTQSKLSKGIDLYSQGKWREAVLELRRIQAEAGSKELRGEALFWISLSELSAGEYQAAVKDMDALEETDPGSRRLKELPYHRGRAFYYLGRYDDAIVFLKRYADSVVPGPDGMLNPAESSRKAAAFYWTGESLFSMGQLEKAAGVFRIITEEYQRSPKYEASLYRLALINQKKVETELLDLLKWSHEEALRNMEEYQRKESAYDQALSAYQKRIADMLKDTRLQELEDENVRYQEQLKSADEKIRSLENTLRETSAALEKVRNSASIERLKTMKTSAQELENLIQERR